MRDDVRNLLYQHPEWYEAVYDGADHAVARLVETVLRTHLGRPPASLLDIGCGTGRDLEYLAKHIPDTVGVDYQQTMIDHARRLRPTLTLHAGDMRLFRLGRTFDAVTCLGYALANIHHHRDIDLVMATYAAHSHPGTILVLELVNPAATNRLPATFTLSTPDIQATATATYHHHTGEQLLERRRVWHGTDTSPDSVRFRLIYPQELAHHLDRHGFEVLTTHTLDEPMNAASTFVVARAEEA
jgi:trans-aconitate methyltransferase